MGYPQGISGFFVAKWGIMVASGAKWELSSQKEYAYWQVHA